MVQVKLAIIGGGPAGLSSAIYTSRAQLAPVVLTGLTPGGQLIFTSQIENYPGVINLPGIQLMSQMQQQAQEFGASLVPAEITKVDFSQLPFQLWTNPAAKNASADQLPPADYSAQAVIVATGAEAIKLGVPGEQALFGKGVSTCAVCDAAFYSAKKVWVIGGGDTALEDALALTKYAAEVNIVHRRDQFRASKIMQTKVLHHPQIKVHWSATVTEIKGDKKVTQIVLSKAGQTQVFPADGVFLAIGHRPATQIFAGQLELTAGGQILTAATPNQAGLALATSRLDDHRVSWSTMSSVPGVFAAGDVADLGNWQAIIAAGNGAVAALEAIKWLDEQAQ